MYFKGVKSKLVIANKNITGNHEIEGICVYTNGNIYISINIIITENILNLLN